MFSVAESSKNHQSQLLDIQKHRVSNIKKTLQKDFESGFVSISQTRNRRTNRNSIEQLNRIQFSNTKKVKELGTLLLKSQELQQLIRYQENVQVATIPLSSVCSCETGVIIRDFDRIPAHTAQEEYLASQLSHVKSSLIKEIDTTRKRINDCEAHVFAISSYLFKAKESRIKAHLELASTEATLSMTQLLCEQQGAKHKESLQKLACNQKKLNRKVNEEITGLAKNIVQREEKQQDVGGLVNILELAVAAHHECFTMQHQNRVFTGEFETNIAILKQLVHKNTSIPIGTITFADFASHYEHIVSQDEELHMIATEMTLKQRALKLQLESTKQDFEKLKKNSAKLNHVNSLKRKFSQLLPSLKPTLNLLRTPLTELKSANSDICSTLERQLLSITKQLASLLEATYLKLRAIVSAGGAIPTPLREASDMPFVESLNYSLESAASPTLRRKHRSAVSTWSSYKPQEFTNCTFSELKSISLDFFLNKPTEVRGFLEEVEKLRFLKLILTRDSVNQYFMLLCDQHGEQACSHLSTEIRLLYQLATEHLKESAQELIRTLRVVYKSAAEPQMDLSHTPSGLATLVQEALSQWSLFALCKQPVVPVFPSEFLQVIYRSQQSLTAPCKPPPQRHYISAEKRPLKRSMKSLDALLPRKSSLPLKSLHSEIRTIRSSLSNLKTLSRVNL